MIYEAQEKHIYKIKWTNSNKIMFQKRSHIDKLS